MKAPSISPAIPRYVFEHEVSLIVNGISILPRDCTSHTVIEKIVASKALRRHLSDQFMNGCFGN